MPNSLLRYALKARYVFPIAGPPIEDGVVTIEGERIATVGRDIAGCEPIELGNVAILPGLCNAHTHLELSSFSSPLGEPGMAFPDWIRQVVAWRRDDGKSYDPLAAIQSGLAESAKAGVTTIGDIASPGSWPDTIDIDSAYVTVFLELIGLRPERSAALIDLAQAHVMRDAAGNSWRPGLSPHAPYTVYPKTLGHVARRFDVPLAVHLAESREELELLLSGSGPLKQLLIDLDAWHRTAIPRGTRPLDYLRILSHARRVLVIHGNYLSDDETAFLAARSDRMAVVYCPRTHAFFRHDPYPLGKLLKAGVTVAFGTDSRASNPDLDLLAEMRFAAQRHPEVPLDTILGLGTLGGQALGRTDVGVLNSGYFADLAVVRLPDREAADPHELLLRSSEPVVATIRRGRIIATRDDQEAHRWQAIAGNE